MFNVCRLITFNLVAFNIDNIVIGVVPTLGIERSEREIGRCEQFASVLNKVSNVYFEQFNGNERI